MPTSANVVQLLADQAAATPERLALAERDRQVTFGDLWRQSGQVHRALANRGLQHGDRVIVFVPMCIDLYVLLLGVIKAGAVAVFADPWMPRRRLTDVCAFVEPKSFVGVPRSHLLRLLDARLRAIPISVTTGRKLWSLASLDLTAIRRGEPLNEIVDACPDDAALITFTSGSSGVPKGANRTHGFLRAQHAALQDSFPNRSNDVELTMFPVFALNNLAGGIPTVIPDMDFRRVGEVDGARLAGQIEQHGVTSVTASPPLIDALTRLPKPPAPRRILSGGAPIDDRRLRTWQKAFPKAEIEVVYGSTEAEPVAHVGARERLEFSANGPGVCCGLPVPQVEAKVIEIVDGPVEPVDDWGRIELPTGEIGELIVAGEHVCIDYYRQPEAVRANKLRGPDGRLWHRMGDTGYLDDGGRFWLVGRVHSTIRLGERVWHAQLVEAAARTALPDEARVAALQVGNGREAALLVVVEGDSNERLASDVQQALRRAGYLPATVRFQPELPTDPRHNSKIDYDRLRAQLR